VNSKDATVSNRNAPEALPKKESEPLRLGIIGCGARGEALIKSATKELNIEWRGVCEVNHKRRKKGVAIAGTLAHDHKNYLDLLDREDIDAVVIATPDHWHAKMAIEAAQRGKHIYLEKCMTRTVDEAIALRDAVRQSGVVFQLGHQGRQRDLNHKAKQLIGNGTIGQITLIETTTNRNDSPGGWSISGEERASPESIVWDLFQGSSSSQSEFSPERYYGWRGYWDYGTGMSGDLFSNEYDAVNSILDLGIPSSAMASGGIYHHLDGREVPDVFQAAFEFPDRKLTLLYSGTLASGIPRGTLFMGKEATLELGRSLSVWVDKDSLKYKGRIESAMMNPSSPFIRYDKEHIQIDAISSPTSKYYADRGLVETYSGGKRINTTYLHLAEWLRCIRNGGLTSCNIERGFEEALSAHMATKAFREERKVHWDAQNERIV
jgi:predicted dehydrogenase